MTRRRGDRADDASTSPAPGTESAVGSPDEARAVDPPHPLEAFLPAAGAGGGASAPPAGLRSASLVTLAGRKATVLLRGRSGAVEARVAPEVDPELVAESLGGGSVLVEADETGELLVVGVLATRRPRELRLRAGSVVLEGEDEVLIRSGRSAVRLRADGDVEVVGSRISASSRGLFKIVGRLLRLN